MDKRHSVKVIKSYKMLTLEKRSDQMDNTQDKNLSTKKPLGKRGYREKFNRISVFVIVSKKITRGGGISVEIFPHDQPCRQSVFHP